MSSVLPISASGLRQASSVIEASAYNIANLMTENYRARRVTAVTAPTGGVVVQLSREPAEATEAVTFGSSDQNTLTNPFLEFDPMQTEPTTAVRRTLAKADPVFEMLNLNKSIFMYSANAAAIRREEEAAASLMSVQA